MLLTYYNIYWHPGLVSDTYLQTVEADAPFGIFTESPGIESDYEIETTLSQLYSPSAGTGSFANYYNYVVAHNTDYFHTAKHKKICGLCSYTMYVAHVTTSGGTKCVHCGATVSSGSPGQILSNGNTVNTLSVWEVSTIVEYITANGSYVLSNGVIVLVDQDMQSYLNGSLNLDAYLY